MYVRNTCILEIYMHVRNIAMSEIYACQKYINACQ